MEKEIKFLGRVSVILGAMFIWATYFISLFYEMGGCSRNIGKEKGMLFGIFFIIIGMLMIFSNLESRLKLAKRVWLCVVGVQLIWFIQDRFDIMSMQYTLALALVTGIVGIIIVRKGFFG